MFWIIVHRVFLGCILIVLSLLEQFCSDFSQNIGAKNIPLKTCLDFWMSFGCLEHLKDILMTLWMICGCRESPIVRFSQSTMQIVWSWKKKFWIDFFIRLNCTIFVDLSTTINPFLTKRWKFDLILMLYLSFKKFNPSLGARSLGIKIKSLKLKLLFTYFCQKIIKFSYYTRHL